VPKARRLHKTVTAGIDNEYIFLFGGHDSQEVFGDFYVFNWQINQWILMPEI